MLSAASAQMCTGAIIRLQAPKRKSYIKLLVWTFTVVALGPALTTGLRLNLWIGLITQLGALLLPALVSWSVLM